MTCLTRATAIAAPWTQDTGDWYTQAAILGQRISGEDAVRLELYAEYGLTSTWTLTAQAEAVTFPQLSGFDQYAYRATARRGIWKRGRFLASVEAGLVGGEAIGGRIGGCASPGGELRLSFGGGGRTKKERVWFAFVDGVIREHGNCRRQRVELGYGQEIAPSWFSVNKVYLETGSGDAESAKVETVISRRFGRTDIGLGYRQEFGGRFTESGIILSVEHRF